MRTFHEFFVTVGGVLVRPVGKAALRDGKWKLPCVRATTGGFHGWLKMRNLQRVTIQ